MCLLPCQFMLLLCLATFLLCCFCAFLGVSQCQMPVPASCLNSLVLSCSFLILFSCSSRRSWLSLTDSLYAWNTLVSSPLGKSRLTSWHPPCTPHKLAGLPQVPMFYCICCSLILSPGIDCCLHGHSANHLLSFSCDWCLHGLSTNCLLSFSCDCCLPGHSANCLRSPAPLRSI